MNYTASRSVALSAATLTVLAFALNMANARSSGGHSGSNSNAGFLLAPAARTKVSPKPTSKALPKQRAAHQQQRAANQLSILNSNFTTF
jgi:hypothetical protein